MNILCIGAGVMSSAFAVAQSTQHMVRILPTPHDEKIVSAIMASGSDPRLDIAWPSIDFVQSIDNVYDIDCIVVGVSSQGISWAIDVVQKTLRKNKEAHVVLLTKGLVMQNGKNVVLSQVVEEAIGKLVHVVTGPCIAKQMAHKFDTNVVLSSRDESVSKDLAKQLSLSYYKIEVSGDHVGCQWAAALKNIYAICVAKTGKNHNKCASVFANSLREMSQWVQEEGGDISSVYGLSGAGDLYVTCMGGRNGMLGQHLSTGVSIDSIVNGPMKGVTVEGLDLAYSLSGSENSIGKHIYTDLMDVINP